MEQKPHLCGVWGDVSNREIAEYRNGTDCLKIMATYDAIPRVMDVLGAERYSNTLLVVDEYHRLLSDLVFRNKAVTGLLEHAPRFTSKTYISATPIEREFLLNELQGMPITKIVWPDSTPLQIRLWEEKSPLQTVARMCRKLIDKNEESNLHIFINSTTAIGRIARYAGVSYDLIKTVCREDDENLDKLGGLQIFTPTGAPRKINFYTSTAFEGCDIYDPKGRIYIVSDGFRSHSMLDVSTSIRQIAGRIRDTQYKEITHMFSKSPYARDVTYEQF